MGSNKLVAVEPAPDQFVSKFGAKALRRFGSGRISVVLLHPWCLPHLGHEHTERGGFEAGLLLSSSSERRAVSLKEIFDPLHLISSSGDGDTDHAG